MCAKLLRHSALGRIYSSASVPLPIARKSPGTHTRTLAVVASFSFSRTALACASVAVRRALLRTRFRCISHQAVQDARDAQEIVADATIETIDAISPTVRKLLLKLDDDDASRFRFFPGMWVDFYIPQIEKVGGYTIISLPEELPYLQLAVKVTNHPPAFWIGHDAKAGDKVILRAGGTFHIADVVPDTAGKFLVDLTSGFPYASPPEQVDHLLMIAGGIGLTPLYAMVRHWISARHRALQGEFVNREIPTKTTLLYSAKTMDELVFLRELQTYEAEMDPPGSFNLVLHVSQGEPPPGAKKGRIQLTDLVAALGDNENQQLNTENVLCCICGPKTMADGMSTLLQALGLRSGQVRLERWW